MSAEENKALVRRAFEEGWNTGNLDLFDETTAPEYVLHDPSVPEEVRGVEGVKRFASMYLRAFPDLRFTIEDQLAEGDKVATRWTSSATHQGELMGIPPTGNQTGVSGIIVSRVSEGKLAEDWNIWDTLGLMRQIGVVPGPGGEAYEHSHRVGEGERRSPMSTEENKALSNRVAEAIGKGDPNALDELMAPGLAEEFKRELAEMRRAFPDYAGTNVEQIAEGERVANRFVFLGTHLGEFEGVAPTGRRVEFIGHSIDRVADGKIVESRIEVDMLGVMRQLGAVPEPGQSEGASSG